MSFHSAETNPKCGFAPSWLKAKSLSCLQEREAYVVIVVVHVTARELKTNNFREEKLCQMLKTLLITLLAK